MKSTTQKLEDIKKFGLKLDFGETLEMAFANYKKIIWISGAVVLVLAIVCYALMFGVMISVFGLTSLADFTEFQQQGGNIGLLVFNLLIGIIMALVIAPLSAGILQMAHNAETFKEFSFATAFEHYKSEYVKDILLATFIVAFTTNVISFAAEMAFPTIDSEGMMNTGNTWVKFLVVVISLLASFLTFFTVPLIIFGNLTAVEAIKGSFTIVFNRFWVIFFLLFVAGIYALLGLIACCIGICFTIPLIYSMQYLIYRTAVDIEEETELDKIGFDSDL